MSHEETNLDVHHTAMHQSKRTSGVGQKEKRTYALFGPPPAVDATDVQNVVVVGATTSKPKKSGGRPGRQRVQFGPPPAVG